MKCTHNDCLTCPYPDCIYEKEVTVTGKPKRTHERSEYWAKYYEANKERIKKRMLDRYYANKERYSAQKKEAYKRKKQVAERNKGDI